jgi:hypothetical protein
LTIGEIVMVDEDTEQLHANKNGLWMLRSRYAAASIADLLWLVQANDDKNIESSLANLC